jgi:hypothetical protein
MKKMMLLFAISAQLFAGVSVTINVNDLLTGERDPYLQSNHAALEKLLLAEASAEAVNIPMDGKNVVQFRLSKEGILSNLTLTQQSKSQTLDTYSKNIVINTFWKFPKPSETTVFRIGFDYKKESK